MDQRQAPLVAALLAHGGRGLLPMHTPGHKGGRGAPMPLGELWGNGLWQCDLTEVPGLDDLHHPQGPIQVAQQLAANLYGAEESFFLVNGSTAGVIAMIMATCGPGDLLLLPRNCHRSALAGLTLSGACPRYLAPVLEPKLGIPLGVTVESVAQALAAERRIKAVLVVSPSYHGVSSDLQGLGEVAHRAGVPLLVDGAHGPHLGFHPDISPGAVACGADIVVHSTHKVLTSLTQSGLLHVQGQRVNRQRLRQALTMLQSSSPSYLLMASIDACRRQLALEGHTRLGQALALVRQVRENLAAFGQGQCLLAQGHLPSPFWLDPTRVTVNVGQWGYSGPGAAARLRKSGVEVELTDLATVLLLITVADGPRQGQQLLASLQKLLDHQGEPRVIPIPAPAPFPPIHLTPREAAFAPQITVPVEQAVGRIAGEALVPYPPGIPLLNPGEEITAGIIVRAQEYHGAGIELQGLADPQFREMVVLDV